MEMAIGNKAACLILTLVGYALACPQEAPGKLKPTEFPVRHKHLNGDCAGVLTVGSDGVSFAGAKKHAWRWKLEDIRQLKLAPEGISVESYHGRFEFAGALPAEELYKMLSGIMDQRLVMQAAPAASAASLWSVPVKHRGGADGSLAFADDLVVYASPARNESRTWRYRDIDGVSSSGPFQLTITTFERAREHYNDRRDFNFELKRPLDEGQYNQLWLLVEKKNGKIQ
jgi:hypothetical protein